MEAIIEKIHKEFKVSADSTLKKSKKFLKSYKPIEIKESSDVDFLKSIGFNNVDFVRQQDEFNKDAVEKNFQDSLLGEIQLNIENFNATRIESRNEYYIKKYVNDVFKYRIINLDF